MKLLYSQIKPIIDKLDCYHDKEVLVKLDFVFKVNEDNKDRFRELLYELEELDHELQTFKIGYSDYELMRLKTLFDQKQTNLFEDEK